MLNKYYRLGDLSKLDKPQELICPNGTIVKVTKIWKREYSHLVGAVQLEFFGKTLKLNLDQNTYWCFFTESMAEKPLNIDTMIEEATEVEFLEQERIHGVKCGISEISTGDKPSLLLTGEWEPKDSKNVIDFCEKNYVKSLQERYDEWVLENLDVYELFCKFTHQAIASGKKKVSHWLIVNRIRWEVEVETVSTCEEDAEFKISNDYIALLARDFIKDYPEHKDIFNLKQMKRA